MIIVSKQAEEIIDTLKSMSSSHNVEGMARFGINTATALGISMVSIRKIAKQIKKDHDLAGELWGSGIHEARILACLIDDPCQVSEEQMERWVSEFNSWDLCDQCCSSLFDKTPHAYDKCFHWSRDDREYVKRAGFVMMATLSVHDKIATDEKFRQFFPEIVRGSTDERNFVKKAVNWALRQMGKRNETLNAECIELGMKIKELDSKSARWIASDALRELQSDAVQKKLAIKKAKS